MAWHAARHDVWHGGVSAAREYLDLRGDRPYDRLAAYRALGLYYDSAPHINQEVGEAGLSYKEFSYQLIQVTDFLYLYQELGVSLQLGGFDQWGNMTTSAELICRMEGKEFFCITCPLITKSDGKKFARLQAYVALYLLPVLAQHLR